MGFDQWRWNIGSLCALENRLENSLHAKGMVGSKHKKRCLSEKLAKIVSLIPSAERLKAIDWRVPFIYWIPLVSAFWCIILYNLGWLNDSMNEIRSKELLAIYRFESAIFVQQKAIEFKLDCAVFWSEISGAIFGFRIFCSDRKPMEKVPFWFEKGHWNRKQVIICCLVRNYFNWIIFAAVYLIIAGRFPWADLHIL